MIPLSPLLPGAPSPYEELLDGEPLLRHPPDRRHEQICGRLHEIIAHCLESNAITRLLPPRSQVQLAPRTVFRPDLALITVANAKAWLAAEIVAVDDHRSDTVLKKAFYEDLRIPRLWMIDPRYDNVEVYHGGPYGLQLVRILAGHECLADPLLPTLQVPVRDLFGSQNHEL